LRKAKSAENKKLFEEFIDGTMDSEKAVSTGKVKGKILIGVPSVMERNDLKRFCLLDREHTQCVEECGYNVQFNLREYVCKRRFEEMSNHLACYARAAPVLSRHCRARCGDYSPLLYNFLGYAQRCRQLFCDHNCTNFVLYRVCPVDQAKSAAAFLLDFTRVYKKSHVRCSAGTTP
uniref:Uncharacterized protein n=1 Tax=Angiostrongylus cantonensis TaxID=6313 RepID=A0A0K0D3B1_ANGCA